MSKVEESVIQAAIEALEIAQRNDTRAVAKIPISPDLPQSSKPIIKTIEKTEVE